MDPAIEQGVFARKQICSPAWLISWSHRRRFQTGLALARRFSGKSLLDYGCGDGTFLAMLAGMDWKPKCATGIEIDDHMVEDCRTRFAGRDGLKFVHFREMDSPAHAGRYEALVCMEVLEHVVAVDAMLDHFERWLAPGGELLISVPVETGLPILVKQAARCVAGWFGVGDYPGTSPYTWGEMGRAVFAGAEQHIRRPLHRSPEGFEFHDHKGFNWMALRAKLAGRFELVCTASSPFLWLRGPCSGRPRGRRDRRRWGR